MNSKHNEKLSLLTKISYGIGEVAGSTTGSIRTFYMMFFITNVAGLNANLAGMILLIGRIWDGINDPLIGWLSDRTHSRWGRRYPWMVAASIPFAIFYFLHWIIPNFSNDNNTNQWGLFWYYVIISLLFDTTFTAVTLPYCALVPELTEDYNERISLNSFQSAFSLGAGIFGLIIAQIIFTIVEDNSKNYIILGIVTGILANAAIYLCVLGTSKRFFSVQKNCDKTPISSELISWRSQLQIIFNNRPFLNIIFLFLCSWLAVQLTATILPYFVVNYMGLTEKDFNLVAITVQLTALIMMFICNFASQKISKKAVYLIAMPLWILSQVGLLFLQPGQIGLLYFLAMLAGIGVAVAYLIPWSMVPDAVDLDELNTGKRREGIFYGFLIQFQKIALALALFLAGKALDLAGFIPSVAGKTPPQQPESALLAIKMSIGPIPALALIIGMILICFYPINREIHTEILLKIIDRRQANQNIEKQ